jgi:site-specific recombinase XerD
MHKGRRTDRPKLPPILQNYSDYIYSTYSEATAEGYIYWPLRLHEFLNEKGRSLEKMTFEDLQFYLNELTTRRKRKEIMQSTVKTVAKTLRTFAEWLMDQRIMDSSEFYKIDKYVEKIPGGDIGDDDKQALTKEEISTATGNCTTSFCHFSYGSA